MEWFNYLLLLNFIRYINNIYTVCNNNNNSNNFIYKRTVTINLPDVLNAFGGNINWSKCSNKNTQTATKWTANAYNFSKIFHIVFVYLFSLLCNVFWNLIDLTYFYMCFWFFHFIPNIVLLLTFSLLLLSFIV